MKKVYPFLLLILVAHLELIQAQNFVHCAGPKACHVGSFGSHGNFLFAGLERGGLYRSADDGLTWQQMDIQPDVYGYVSGYSAPIARCLLALIIYIKPPTTELPGKR